MGLAGMVISGISTVIGAIMYWALTAQSSSVVQQHGFRLSTVGVILMIAGVLGFIVSAIVYATSRRAVKPPATTIVRETADDMGHAVLTREERR